LTVWDLEVVYSDFVDAAVVVSADAVSVAEPDTAAKTSAGAAIGATIAAVSIRLSANLARVCLMVMFLSESVLFFMIQVLLCDSYNFTGRPEWMRR
jgi:cephalosporin-C deacetylase-like acetyl esterase